MGRGKVELRRIENKINRQVTFAKRKNGLMKKASELSVLCDAEVALIIFSARGKLYEFCSSSSMAKTIERYQRYCYTALDHEANLTLHDIQMRDYQDYVMLKARVDHYNILKGTTTQSLLGEDLESLNTKELELLEVKLDSSLKNVRSSKTQMLLNQISELHKKEEVLVETNKALKNKLEETNTALGPIWEDEQHHYPHHQQDQTIPFIAQADHGFSYHPLLHRNTHFPIGSNYNSVETNPQNMRGFVPSGWKF